MEDSLEMHERNPNCKRVSKEQKRLTLQGLSYCRNKRERQVECVNVVQRRSADARPREGPRC